MASGVSPLKGLVISVSKLGTDIKVVVLLGWFLVDDLLVGEVSFSLDVFRF
jgi:hypothetical protein